MVGDFVITECDRKGEDLGVVIDILSVEVFLRMRNELRMQVCAQKAEETGIEVISRLAIAAEKQQLPAKHRDEATVLKVRFVLLTVPQVC